MVHPSIRPSVHQSFIHQSFSLSIHQSIHPSIQRSIYHPSLYLSISLSISPSINHQSIHPSIYPSVYPSSIYPAIHPDSTTPIRCEMAARPWMKGVCILSSQSSPRLCWATLLQSELSSPVLGWSPPIRAPWLCWAVLLQSELPGCVGLAAEGFSHIYSGSGSPDRQAPLKGGGCVPSIWKRQHQQQRQQPWPERTYTVRNCSSVSFLLCYFTTSVVSGHFCVSGRLFAAAANKWELC